MKIIRFFFLLFKKRMIGKKKIDPYGMYLKIEQNSAKILKELSKNHYIVIYLEEPYKVEKVQYGFMSKFVPLQRALFNIGQDVMVNDEYGASIKKAKRGKITSIVNSNDGNPVRYKVTIRNDNVDVDQRKIFPYSKYLQKYITSDEYEGKENNQTLMSGGEKLYYRLKNSSLSSTLNTFQLFYLNMFFRLFFQHKTFAPKIEKYTLFFIMTSNNNTSTVAEDDDTIQAGKLENDFLGSCRIYKLRKTTCKRLFKNIVHFVSRTNRLLEFNKNDIYHVPSRKMYDIVTSINRHAENIVNSTNTDYFLIIQNNDK